MHIVVIKVKKDGNVKYMKSLSFFDVNPLVDHPHQAEDFSQQDDTYVGYILSNIRYPGHEGARNSIYVDEAPVVVKVEIKAKEIEVLSHFQPSV